MERLQALFKSKRNIVILILFIIQVLSQAIGALFYSSFPDWFWATCDALILVTPLMFGLVPGVICCLPNFVAEIIWLIVKGYLGAFLHGVAFMVAVTDPVSTDLWSQQKQHPENGIWRSIAIRKNDRGDLRFCAYRPRIAPFGRRGT